MKQTLCPNIPSFHWRDSTRVANSGDEDFFCNCGFCVFHQLQRRSVQKTTIKAQVFSYIRPADKAILLETTCHLSQEQCSTLAPGILLRTRLSSVMVLLWALRLSTCRAMQAFNRGHDARLDEQLSLVRGIVEYWSW